MHELSIAQNIFNIIMGNMNEGRIVGKVVNIRLRIGRMTAIVPENLAFMFEVVSRETPLEKAGLEIDTIPIQCICEKCHAEFEMDAIGFICPSCGSSDVKITSGRELEIESVEVE